MSAGVKIRDFVSTDNDNRSIRPQPQKAIQTEERNRKTLEHTSVRQLRSPPRPFRDCDIAFAIDISQSTRGAILAEECALIENFADRLNPKARDWLRILPWDEIPHPVIQLQELPSISPAGRTDPTVLLRNRDQIDVLQNCHLWFLLTDGEIVPQIVRKFAFGIASRGLHGTACIVVIFGSRPAKPILCNISVGISVFAVSPSCMFVFHDADTHTAYVLQSKGCFNALLPGDRREVNLDNDTEWSGLPQLHYTDLLVVKIPAPTKLAATDFQLQSGHRFDFEDLYKGKLGKELENELLSSQDDLKSAVLTATSRGQSEDMHRWLAGQRDNTAGSVSAPRPDVDGNGAWFVREAIRIIKEIPEEFKPNPALLQAHEANWSAFAASIEPRAPEKTEVFEQALDRLAFIDEEGPASPGGLSPRIPGGMKRRHDHFRPHRRKGPRVLYTRGYRLDEDSMYATGGFDCPLCGAVVTHMALLFKLPIPGPETPGLPKASSFSTIMYPLAIGNFRETDIISDFICCDACSSFAVDYGKSPYNESLIGALILGPDISFNDDINKRTFVTTVQRAFDGRFSRESALLGFLAVVYYARKRSDNSTALNNCLFLAQSALERIIVMPYEIGNPSRTGSVPDVVSHYLMLGTSSHGCDFLDHPFDACVIMIASCQYSKITPLRKTIALFHRLLLHLIEHAFVVQGTEFEGAAMHYYGELGAQLITAVSSPDFADIESIGKLSLQSLCDNHIASNDAISILKTAITPFNQLEHHCSPALILFLHLFNTVNTGRTEPREILNWFLDRSELKFLIGNPSNKDHASFKTAWEALA